MVEKKNIETLLSELKKYHGRKEKAECAIIGFAIAGGAYLTVASKVVIPIALQNPEYNALAMGMLISATPLMAAGCGVSASFYDKYEKKEKKLENKLKKIYNNAMR